MANANDSKKRKVWHEVACKEHGRGVGDPNIPMSVRISVKGTKAERQGLIGCPQCRREKGKKN